MKNFILLLVLLTLPLSGCGLGKRNASSDTALCDGLSEPIDELNDSLLEDGGPKSIVSGVKVIAVYDGGCNGE